MSKAVDSWTRPEAGTSKQAAATTTPTRATRSKAHSTETTYPSFTRAFGSSSHLFAVGDAVVLSARTPTRQRWLAPMGKHDQGWRDKASLENGEKVALIVGLYEDAAGVKMARFRWFARPESVWGGEGPKSGFEVDENEIYYTADSTFVQETQETSCWTPGSFSLVSTYKKSSLSTDPFPISFILHKVHILSDDEYAIQSKGRVKGTEKGKGKQTEVPLFRVKKVYDAKPLEDGEFIGDIDWEAVYAKGRSTGAWDIEPIPLESDEEEEPVVRKKASPSKRRVGAVEEEDARSPKRARASPTKGPTTEMRREAARIKREGIESRRAAKELHKQLAAMEAANTDSEDGSDSDEHNGASGSSDDDSDALGSDAEDQDEEGLGREDSEAEGNVGEESPSKRRPVRSSPTKSSPQKSTAFTQAARRKAAALAVRKAAIAVSKKRKLVQPRLLSSAILPPSFANLSPFEQARALLHVGATPDYLPCREEEQDDIREKVGDAILGRTGNCIYISGVPGTGKTATVRSVIKSLQEDEDMDDFSFLEINGMKISEPYQAFSQLWEFVSDGKKASPRVALGELEKYFGTPDMLRKTTVVLVDELDQMVTKKQDVIYNFFNWPHVPHSRLIVIAIANTMDLPERELSGKIRSRLGSNRINFKPYDFKQLEEIIRARLEGLDVFIDNAITLAAKKVAGVSGDARRALDICRRTVEKVDQINADRIKDGEESRMCTIADVNTTYNEMTNYGSNFFIKRLGLHPKIMMLAIVQCTKRAGIPEVPTSEIFSWHLDFLRQTSINPVPSHSDLFTSLANLHSLRLVAAESQRSDYFGKVRLLVEDSDVFAALKDEEVLGRHIPRFT